MKFCLDDGTALLPATIVTDPNATLVLPQPRRGEPGHTVGIPQTPTLHNQPMSTQADQVFESPGVRPAEPSRKSVLPWILGIVVVLGASGIVIAFMLGRALLPEGQRADQTGMATSSPTPAGITARESPLSTSVNSSDVPRPAVASNSPVRTQSDMTDAQTSPIPKARIAPTPSSSPPGEPQPAPTRAPISGGVMNGKAVYLVQPPYPVIARQVHASGLVTVQVVIDENGNVVSAHATSGHPLLQGAAVAAARASKFSPTKLSGQPVKVTGMVQYNFVAQ